MELLPWFQDIHRNLVKLGKAGTLSHAQLITGPRGIGKNQMVESLVQSLLCERVSESEIIACGDCRSCIQHLAGTHPDCMVISPEPESRSAFRQYPGQESQDEKNGARKSARKNISVNQIREMSSWVASSSHYGGYKVVIISPADSMNENAANSLLKMLEEPPGSAIYFLISAESGRLLPTVISRCQLVECPVPLATVSQAWLFDHVGKHDNAFLALELARGAPLLARQHLADETIEQWRDMVNALDGILAGRAQPMQVAEHWEEVDFERLLPLLLHWFHALIKFSSHIQADFSAEETRLLLRNQTQKVHLKSLFRLLDQLQAMNQYKNVQLNRRMQWEGFLQEWHSAAI